MPSLRNIAPKPRHKIGLACAVLALIALALAADAADPWRATGAVLLFLGGVAFAAKS